MGEGSCRRVGREFGGPHGGEVHMGVDYVSRCTRPLRVHGPNLGCDTTLLVLAGRRAQTLLTVSLFALIVRIRGTLLPRNASRVFSMWLIPVPTTSLLSST
jgi:hypothetical protein